MPTIFPAYCDDGSASASRLMRCANSMLTRKASSSSMHHLRTERPPASLPRSGRAGQCRPDRRWSPLKAELGGVAEVAVIEAVEEAEAGGPLKPVGDEGHADDKQVGVKPQRWNLDAQRVLL